MKTNLIIDTSNILFRVNSMNAKQYFSSPEERAGLALHVSFQSINKYYKRFKPDRLIFTFEGQKNWRKTYTKTDECVRKQPYKGNRIKDKSMIPFFELINSFRDVMENHSSTFCVSDINTEADDVIAGIVQLRDNRSLVQDFIIQEDEEIIILSGDKDFVQLLEHDNVRLIDPQTGDDKMNAKSMQDYKDDIGYYMFEKYVRGDKGDNVFSAFPRVRAKVIREAYENDYKRLEFMNETWSMKDEDGEIVEEFRVGDLFDENKLLIDLGSQPQYVKDGMYKTINECLGTPKKYNHFQFSKFLGTNGLINISENINQYIDMLSGKHQNSPKIQKKIRQQSSETFPSEDNVIVEDRTKKSDVLEF